MIKELDVKREDVEQEVIEKMDCRQILYCKK